MRYIKKFMRNLMILTLVGTSVMTMGVTEVFAASNVELIGEIKNFKNEVIWDEPDYAPTLKVNLEDAHKIKGENEVFNIELTNARWVEGRNTTLSITAAEGIEVYEASVYVRSDTLAEVTVKIPRDIEEDEKISMDIPLLIKVTEGAEDVSATIKKTNEDGLIEDMVVPIANTSSKWMNWKVEEVPIISEGESIAPIIFKETAAGILGSREIDFWINIKNRYICFDEPAYISKIENADNIDYYLDVDDYIEYSGGFTRTDQKLRVSISKDGKSMRVRMSGSIPTERGVIVLKNLPIKSTHVDASKEKVVISIQGDTLINNNGEAIVAYFEPTQQIKEEVEKEEIVEADKDTEENINTITEEVWIKFKMGQSYYTLNDKAYPMDGKAFIKSPGYTMVPVRYVAEALGVDEVKFKEGIVSFTYNDKEIVLTVGSMQATVNKEVIMMQVPLEIVQGRVYAPMGEVANLLGLDKVWDSASQTACFSKDIV